MSGPRQTFLPSCVYHIYNHSNGSDNIFVEKDNYLYFLMPF